ncbi:hypothetical protein Tco_1568487 [Tanacetum coccineum]
MEWRLGDRGGGGDIGGGSSGVIGGVGVVSGDGVDNGVGEVKASISTMIVSVPKKDRWCGTRGKFVGDVIVDRAGGRILSKATKTLMPKGMVISKWEKAEAATCKGIDHSCCHNEEGFDGSDGRKQVFQLLSDDRGEVRDFVNAYICSVTSVTSLAILITSSTTNSARGSPVLPHPLPVRPPVLPPHGATVDRPALCVVILGGIIYTREDIGGNTRRDGDLIVKTQGVNIEKSKCIEQSVTTFSDNKHGLVSRQVENISHSLELLQLNSSTSE